MKRNPFKGMPDVLVFVRCGGKSGVCRTIQAAVFSTPAPDRGALIVYRSDRPCRCFVTPATIAMNQSDELVAIVRAAERTRDQCVQQGKTFKAVDFVAAPRSGSRIGSAIYDTDDTERAALHRLKLHLLDGGSDAVKSD